MEAVVDDAAFARQLNHEYNANRPRASARTALKPTPMPVQPASKKAPVSRAIRAKKPNQKASDSDGYPKQPPVKRGRAAKRRNGIKKTPPKSVANRKTKTTATPMSGSKAAKSPDVAMHDVDAVIGPPSPALSTESDVSSFTNSSSTSSHPSPEPDNGHLIDEAEKIDLLEGSAAQKTIVS